MNERIKELAAKAGFGPKWTETSEPGTPANINEMVVREFAELIILECVKYVDETGYMENSIAADIKKHFGVE